MGWVETNDGRDRCLAIGSLSAAQNLRELRSEGVTHVLTVASRLRVWSNDKGDAETQYPSFLKGYLQVDLVDHPGDDLFVVAPRCLEFLRQALDENDEERDNEHRVLVHCASGASRSVSIVAAYLMRFGHAASLEESLTMIRKGRPHANPNVGFFHQLLCFERTAPDFDLSLAGRIYRESLEGKSIMELIQGQRDDANALHTQLDMITRSSDSDTTVLRHKLEKWLALNARQNDKSEGFTTNIVARGKGSCESSMKVVDRASVSIRRAAIQRATSLIKKHSHTVD